MRYIGVVYQNKRSGKLQTTRMNEIVVKCLLAPALLGSILGGFFFAYQMYVILLSIMMDSIQRGIVP